MENVLLCPNLNSLIYLEAVPDLKISICKRLNLVNLVDNIPGNNINYLRTLIVMKKCFKYNVTNYCLLYLKVVVYTVPNQTRYL